MLSVLFWFFCPYGYAIRFFQSLINLISILLSFCHLDSIVFFCFLFSPFSRVAAAAALNGDDYFLLSFFFSSSSPSLLPIQFSTIELMNRLISMIGHHLFRF
uniref:Uncharacterized protein n=1 Tax=Anopheles darlingi TaxID=43151 RepID=A0A2M4D8C5_ANODA